MGMLLHASRLLDWEKRTKSFKQKCLTLQGISLAAMAAALLLAPRSGGEIRWRCRRQEEEGVGERRGSFCNGKCLSRGFSKKFLSTILLPDESGSQSLDRTVKNQRTLVYRPPMWPLPCGRGNPPPPASAGSREP